MSEQSRHDRTEAWADLRRIARREYLLLVQAGIAVVVLVAIVWVRQAFFA
ncbi:hypothetical protein [Protaetiibacter mangrovi]|uniref:Uncharacterized protein n=1 Tax=Protaetiibacter mangrovi TaxID=2970926 RepID=A0ABT1ZHC5_9MICO|nr:hypothetical protein [Protaetiibacter mangrovi]MCS0499990.1 hypothetical protein [Protaetiibacter mangrovi]